jgi:hypothetical protein
MRSDQRFVLIGGRSKNSSTMICFDFEFLLLPSLPRIM